MQNAELKLLSRDTQGKGKATQGVAGPTFKKSLRGSLRNCQFASKAAPTAFGEGAADRL